MIQAAPLVLSFARAVPMLNKLVGAVGITELGNRVNNYIQENPDESAKIVSMIMPTQGIANALKNKSSEDVEEVEETEEVTTGSGVEEKIKEILVGEGVDIEGVDLGELPKDLQSKVMKGIAKSSSNKQKDMKEASAIIGLSGPARETKKMVDEIDDRYEGGLEEVTKTKGYDFRDYIPKGAYKKKYADGGAIGIEVLFEEKKPRKNFFMGGPALTGQPLAIYNSMSAYNSFTDQEIANAIKEAGYSLPTADSGTTPPGSTPGNNLGYQGESDNFSPYNPDPNTIRSVRTDPRIAAANEADVRTKQLTSMGINDPFANEASLSGAYYGDMPEDTSNQIGKQSMFAKAKQGLTGLMDNPITSAIGFAINPAFGAIKGIAKGIGSMIPVNQRAIQENIMGNLGFAVNDIGQIVSTGDYDDESGDNVMAGYNLNRMTVDTFKNRIDKIRNRKIAQTAASRARIKAIEEAQRKFQLAEKLKAEKLAAKAQEEQRAREAATADRARAANPGVYASADRQGFTDGKGGGFGSKSTGTNDAFGNKSGRGRTGYSEGGLVTMFKEKR